MPLAWRRLVLWNVLRVRKTTAKRFKVQLLFIQLHDFVIFVSAFICSSRFHQAFSFAGKTNVQLRAQIFFFATSQADFEREVAFIPSGITEFPRQSLFIFSTFSSKLRSMFHNFRDVII